MRRAFVIRPFGTKKDLAGNEIDFDRVSEKLIEPALKAAQLGGGTTGEVIEAGNIREDMFRFVPNADLVLCDITILNANVFYELGIRHALRAKRTILIRGVPSADDIPFDILTDRYLAYNRDAPEKSVQQLTNTLNATLASNKLDSPVFKYLPNLPEVDPDLIRTVPNELREEVERARAGRAAGWLRLLSEDVETRDFQWPALRLIGQAQWDIGDDKGASCTFQKLVGESPDDSAANEALASLYEEQFRRQERSELLTASDQASRRVAAGGRGNQPSQNLAGRYARILWRQSFEGLPQLIDRRKAATNRQLIEACDGFVRAYFSNLSNCRAGLAALQMCAVANSLAAEDEWENAFNDEPEAKAKREQLKIVESQLTTTTRIAVSEAQKLPANSDERIWAEIANADWLFLTDSREMRVRRAYKDSVPNTARFVDAVVGQLRIFARLGIKRELAAEIIADLGVAVDLDSAMPTFPGIVIVAGHRIDDQGRPKVRFPESAAAAVRDRLREKLVILSQHPGGVEIMASAAPGTDILCHELCKTDLSLKATMCLPMPVDRYSSETFKDMDGWRSRFLTLVAAQIPCLQLSDESGLPKWLQGTGMNPWERGNRWVLQLALSAVAPKVSLIAVLDDTQASEELGGTAHMVQIARAAGRVDVDIIKLKDGAVVAAGV